jgi:hypothetical protein
MSPAMSTALVAGAVSVIVSVFTTFGALYLQRERLRTELRTEFMAEESINTLLRHKTWKRRSFFEIQRRIRGFTDDELRKLLIRAGAVAFSAKEGGAELWGLRDRNADVLDDFGPDNRAVQDEQERVGALSQLDRHGGGPDNPTSKLLAEGLAALTEAIGELDARLEKIEK